MAGAVVWASVGRVWSEPSRDRVAAESVEAHVVELGATLAAAHIRWMRYVTTLPAASAAPALTFAASFQLAGSLQSGSAAATFEKYPLEIAAVEWSSLFRMSPVLLAKSQLTPAWIPWSAAFDVACRNPILPARMVAVSTERIVAIPARVMATSTMSAMIRTVPPCRRRRWGACERTRSAKEAFMSARLPYPVSQGNRRLENAIAVAFPVVRSGHARAHVEPGLVVEPATRPGRSGPLGLGRGRVAGVAVVSSGRLVGLGAARDHGDPHGDETRPGGEGRVECCGGHERVERGGIHIAVDDAVARLRQGNIVGHRQIVDPVVQAVKGAHVHDVVGDRGAERLACADLELRSHGQAAVGESVGVVYGQIDGRVRPGRLVVEIAQIEYARHVRRAVALVDHAQPAGLVEPGRAGVTRNRVRGVEGVADDVAGDTGHFHDRALFRRAGLDQDEHVAVAVPEGVGEAERVGAVLRAVHVGGERHAAYGLDLGSIEDAHPVGRRARGARGDGYGCELHGLARDRKILRRAARIETDQVAARKGRVVESHAGVAEIALHRIKGDDAVLLRVPAPDRGALDALGHFEHLEDDDHADEADQHGDQQLHHAEAALGQGCGSVHGSARSRVDVGGHGVVVRRKPLGDLFGQAPPDNDLHGGSGRSHRIRNLIAERNDRRLVRAVRELALDLVDPGLDLLRGRSRARIGVGADVPVVGPHLREQLLREKRRFAAVFGARHVLDRHALHPHHREDADREDQDRDQRLDQHDAALATRRRGWRSCAHIRLPFHGHAGQPRGSVAASAGSHRRVLPPGLTMMRRGRLASAAILVLVTSILTMLGVPSAFAVTFPSDEKVTVVAASAAAGAGGAGTNTAVAKAFGEPSALERDWTICGFAGSAGSDFTSHLPVGSPRLTTQFGAVCGSFVSAQLDVRSETNWKRTGPLMRTPSARATCRPFSAASAAERICWFCSHSEKAGAPSMSSTLSTVSETRTSTTVKPLCGACALSTRRPSWGSSSSDWRSIRFWPSSSRDPPWWRADWPR